MTTTTVAVTSSPASKRAATLATKAKLFSAVPAEHEIGDETPIEGAKNLYAHPILSDAMEPVLKRGEIYVFDDSPIPNDCPPDGSIVAVYFHIKHLKEVAVVRRFFHDKKTGLVTLKAEKRGVPPIIGKLTRGNRDPRPGELWPFAILQNEKAVRVIQLPKPKKAESEYVTIEPMDGIDHGKPSNSNIYCSRPISRCRYDPTNEVTFPKPAKFDDSRVAAQTKEKFRAVVPLNDAMAPMFPEGEYIILRNLEKSTHGITPGDIVHASVLVTGRRDRLVKRAFSIVRRFGVDAHGKTILTPLQDGFSTLTEGQRFEDGKIEIRIDAVATQYKALLHNSTEVLFYVPKGSHAKEVA